MSNKVFLTAIAAVMLLSACAQTIPKEALALTHESLRDRQIQTRKFSTKNEKVLLSAGAQVVQDMGFTIDESEMPLGLIAASKTADATNGAQIAGAVMMGVLFGVGAMPATDKEQKIRASLVTRPSTGGMTNLRVTFQRVVWNTQGQVCKTEFLNDEQLYKDFFSKLSKSVFLQAHEI